MFAIQSRVTGRSVIGATPLPKAVQQDKIVDIGETEKANMDFLALRSLSIWLNFKINHYLREASAATSQRLKTTTLFQCSIASY
jgi:hypothetical protein